MQAEYIVVLVIISFFVGSAFASKNANEARQRVLNQLSAAQDAIKDLTARLNKAHDQLDSEETRFRIRLSKFISQTCARSFLANTPAYDSLSDGRSQRVVSALTASMQLSPPYTLSAQVVGQDGIAYHTTLTSCTCPDFQFRNKVCKHMIFLAIQSGVLASISVDDKSQKLLAFGQAHTQYKKELSTLSDEKALLTKLHKSSQQCPWMAQIIADYHYHTDTSSSEALRHKARPALKAADEVAKIALEKRTLMKENKALQYQLDYLRSVFPWLDDFMEVPTIEAYHRLSDTSVEPNAEQDFETFSSWLSQEEYSRLTDVEKYQLALDRHNKSKKTNWEIGIEYERYIGYLCEQKGYKVQYYGATQKLEDMGRDLLLYRGNQIIAIQCKRWANHKTIHENHIFQLCGTTYHLQEQHPDKEVLGVFVTTTTFSDVALQCAEKLNVRLYSNVPAGSYPVIKCNISRTGEKIFHLPMDQQYDTAQIDRAGEFYAHTVQEAIDAGFRRAYRWKGTNP